MPLILFNLKRARLPSWPWKVTMLTAANCYLLWMLTWLQFLVTLVTFSYKGKNLWFYTASGEAFGLTIPELFLVFSIALSVFAACAVAGATWQVPRLWKRLLAVIIFAGIAIGFSCVNLQLRHYIYVRALESYAERHDNYHRNLMSNYNSSDEWRIQDLEREKNFLEGYDSHLKQYREKYGVADLP